MKPAFFLLLFVPALFLQCHKSVPVTAGYTGRLIVNGPCEHYAIQLLQGTVDTAHVVSSWFDSDNDSTYDNAFSVSNYCGFGGYGLQLGDVFTFQVDPHPMTQTCPVCATAVAVPAKFMAVIDVKKVK